MFFSKSILYSLIAKKTKNGNSLELKINFRYFFCLYINLNKSNILDSLYQYLHIIIF